jgi:hypothetical protein
MHRTWTRWGLALLAWEGAAARLPSGPLISEFMADNRAGIQDRYGNHSDWIELF